MGWCTQLQEPSSKTEFEGKGWADGAGAFVAVESTTLQKYQAWEADELVERLDDMYFEEEPRSLVKFEEIISGVIDYHSHLS